MSTFKNSNLDERDETIVEEWPEPDDYEDEDWDDYEEEPEGPLDYEIRFKAKGLTETEINWISRYLFEAIEKELEIPYSKFEDLEIEED